MSLHGWLVIDKPEGMSSAHVVARVKRLLKPSKIGHAGTLDPFATGVLPLALGEATKTAGYGLDKDKSYQFTLTFGAATDTEDCTGKVIETSEKRPTLAEIEAVLPQFRGELLQVPPIYSAIHVDGKRAYALARAGQEVVMEPRKITIQSLEVAGSRKQEAEKNSPLPAACFLTHCSKGTYIRSLARDMARALGTVGHVSALRRTKSGPFTLAQAVSLESLESADISSLLQPVYAVLEEMPVLQVEAAQAAQLRQGKTLNAISGEGLMQARLGEELVALGEVQQGVFTIRRGFGQTGS